MSELPKTEPQRGWARYIPIAVIAAVVTWAALYGVNPIDLTTPSS